ncbi:peptidase family M48-domain-containing protein, partial [Vararia minispora EC-137]
GVAVDSPDSLEKIPETGRWRFMVLPKRYEEMMWEESIQAILRDYNGKIVHPDHPVAQRVQRVAARILEANDLGTLRTLEQAPGHSPRELVFGSRRDTDDQRPADVHTELSKKQWNLLVVNDPRMINAFAAPGTIVVFTGLLRVLPNDDSYLAAVLGHVLRHSVERVSASIFFFPLRLLTDVLVGSIGIGGLIDSLFRELPNSRTAEFEADTIGLRLSSKACYDPAAAPEVFKLFAKIEREQGGLQIDFLQTHPASERRVKKLQEQLPDAQAIRAASPSCSGVGAEYQLFRDMFTWY